MTNAESTGPMLDRGRDARSAATNDVALPAVGETIDLTDDLTDASRRPRLVARRTDDLVVTEVEMADGFYVRRVKYPLERSLAIVLLIVLAPVLVAIALAIRINMGPGVVYEQRRVGRDGRVFVMRKFRTMDQDRRVLQRPFPPPDRRATHKTKDDPRHRRLGRMLRATGLDELPQLWDVIKGNMSLIGPRPELETVVEKLGLWNHPRHRVRPGITGLWQVSPVRRELLHENIHIDVEYLEQVSPRLDLSIVMRTVMMPFHRTGS